MNFDIDKLSALKDNFKATFLKPSLPDSAVDALLEHSELLEPGLHTRIFVQGDNIEEYYFLVRGIVALHKQQLNGSQQEGHLL
jgi:CRP-like cAMP-binding protein